MYEVRTKKYKDKVRKDETSCAQYMLNRDRYNNDVSEYTPSNVSFVMLKYMLFYG
jgi:hypothetical protein